MEIKLSKLEAMEIIEKHFKDKGYELEKGVPVMFTEDHPNYCFSILVKYNIKDSLTF